MLPQKLQFHEDAVIEKSKFGWRVNMSQDKVGTVHPSFIKAVQHVMTFSGRLVITEVERLFLHKKVYLEDCLAENLPDFVHVIRWAWKGGYDHYQRMRRAKSRPPADRDSITPMMKADVAALRKLQRRFPLETYPSLWATLEEGCGQIQELIDIPKRNW